MITGQKSKKDWWAPVWKGLVADPEGKHYRRMKNAVWLFLYLLLNADRRNGLLFRKVKTICSDTGLPRDTILRWLGALKDGGYICTKNTGRFLSIVVKKWKNSGGVANMVLQESEKSNFSSRRNPIPEEESGGRDSAHLSQESMDAPGANEISTKKYKLKNDIEDLDLSSNSFNGMDQIIKKYLLAFYLAKALNDEKGLPLYLSYSKRYPEALLIKVLEQVKQMPDEKIKKGRGALFNYLIQKHVQ